MANIKKGVGVAIVSIGLVLAMASGALGFSIGVAVERSIKNSIEAVDTTISTSDSDQPQKEKEDNSTNGATKIKKDDAIAPNGAVTPPAETPESPKEEENVTMNEKPLVKADKGFKVVGYYPSWDVGGRNKIRYDITTHIIYAFAIPNADGTIKPLENPENAQALIKDGHKNNVKVLLALGGWSYNDNPLEPVFKSATDTPAKIDKLVAETMKLVDSYGFDGVDLDWEHPRFADVTQKQYLDLLKAFRKAVDKKGLLLTSAVLSGVSADGLVMYDSAAHSDEAIAMVDWLNVMAYDGGDAERHSSYDFAVNCTNYWTKTRKVAKEKVVLGVPFYGRPSWAAYEDILAANPDAHKSDTSTINGMVAHYNGIETITKKTNYAIQNAGGVMIWELSQDCLDKDKSLLNAIGKAVK